jgi:PAS domain S-box-containing protein
MLSIYTDKLDIARQVIEISPNPTYIKNEQGKYILLNQAYASIYGVSKDRLIAEENTDFDYAYEKDLELLRSGGTATFEELYRVADGGKAWFRTTKTSFLHQDGQRYLMSQSTDITALKEAVQFAEVNAIAMSQLLHGISSEIKAPIAAIQLAAEHIKKDNPIKEQEEHLNTILAAADNLLTVPQDLREVASMEAGEIRQVSIPFSIQHTLRDTAKAMTHHMAQQGGSVQLEEHLDHLPTVEGDPFRLGYILMHLISSVVIPNKHTEITLSAHIKERLESSVTVELTIHSVYIDPPAANVDKEASSRIEERTRQTHFFEETKAGFTLCQHLIEVLGGKTWKEHHPGLGKSVHFSITYPTTSRITTLLPEEQLIIFPEQLKGLNILVITDTRLSELLLLAQLHVYGVNTDVATDSGQAQQKIRSKAYDLILIDQKIPAKKGLPDTYHLGSRHHLNGQLPIIALVPYGQELIAEVANQNNITAYLQKPYHVSSLYHLIARHTERLMDIREIKASPHAIPNDFVLYDFSGLGELKDDAVFIRKMQRMFIETVPEQLKELKEAVKQNELAKVARMAHKLKSTYGSLGMREATEAMKRIEQYAQEGKMLEEAFDLLQKTTGITGRVEAVFSEQLKAN